MGLNVSHNCFNGAYSSYNEWRRVIAKHAGIENLGEMEGFMKGKFPNWQKGTRPWTDLKPDILHTLINHSDCDGEIFHIDCKPLALRLTEILPLIERNDEHPYACDYRTTQNFINGLMSAHEKNHNVIFS